MLQKWEATADKLCTPWLLQGTIPWENTFTTAECWPNTRHSSHPSSWSNTVNVQLTTVSTHVEFQIWVREEDQLCLCMYPCSYMRNVLKNFSNRIKSMTRLLYDSLTILPTHTKRKNQSEFFIMSFPIHRKMIQHPNNSRSYSFTCSFSHRTTTNYK